jgi:hypothetical protein
MYHGSRGGVIKMKMGLIGKGCYESLQCEPGYQEGFSGKESSDAGIWLGGCVN